MRFTLALVLGAAVAVSAQSATSSAAAPESSQDVCLKNCGNDVNCKAHCIAVPSPNEDQANATTKCSMECKQGSGSPEDTKAYGECLDACRTKYYYNSESGTPNQSANPGSGSGSSSAAASPSSAGAANPSASSAAGTSAQSGSGISTAASGSASSASASQSASKTEGGSSGSQTSATASATASQNAAAGLVGASASFLGFVAALFAL